MIARTLALSALMALLLMPPALAGQEKPKGKPEAAQSGKAKAGDIGGEVELRTVRDYYARAGTKLKPLPPGIAKNLARGKPLPPGIARTRMPDDLVGKLPKVAGREWAVVGDQLLQLDTSGIVLNILGSIF